jgi:hypothetical protein
VFEVEIEESCFYKVVHSKTIICRDNVKISDSKIVGMLTTGTIVKSNKKIGRRIYITEPIVGWVSLENEKGYRLLMKIETDNISVS